MKPQYGLCLAISLALASKIQAEKFHFGQWINTDVADNFELYVFETATLQEIQNCIESCKAKKQCKFINFDHRANLCYHIGSNSSMTFERERKPGFYFGNKTERNMEKYVVCEGCNKFGVCKNEDDHDYAMCLPSGCEPPENKEHAIFLRNMFSIGNRVEYECKEGYRTNKTVRLTSTCFENGTWSSVDVTCLPEAVFGNDVYEFHNNFYKLIRIEQDWDSAHETCSSLSLHLVDINYPEEQSFITQNIVETWKCYWTGGKRKTGEFIWLDGTAVVDEEDLNWGDDQPDNYNEFQNCIALNERHSYKLNDIQCSRQCHAICELI